MCAEVNSDFTHKKSPHLPEQMRDFVFFLEAALTLLLEAGTAVDRTIAAGLERNLSGLAAAIADHVKHLTLATGSAATILRATGCAAGRATTGLILEALVSIELLLGSGENELGAALTASQSLVLEHGIYPPKCVCPYDGLCCRVLSSVGFHRRDTVSKSYRGWGYYTTVLPNCTAFLPRIS